MRVDQRPAKNLTSIGTYLPDAWTTTAERDSTVGGPQSLITGALDGSMFARHVGSLGICCPDPQTERQRTTLAICPPEWPSIGIVPKWRLRRARSPVHFSPGS